MRFCVYLFSTASMASPICMFVNIDTTSNEKNRMEGRMMVFLICSIAATLLGMEYLLLVALVDSVLAMIFEILYPGVFLVLLIGLIASPGLCVLNKGYMLAIWFSLAKVSSCSFFRMYPFSLSQFRCLVFMIW